MATNLIQVKPYHFFQNTGDIHAPPGMSKHELDGKGVNFSDLEEKVKESVEKAKTTVDQSNAASDDVDQDEMKAQDDEIPKTPDHIVEENIADYLPESAGDDENVEASTGDKEATVNVETMEASTSAEPSSSAGTVDAIESTSETADDKPIETLQSPTESVSDDNLIEIEDPDDYLLYLESILQRIHSRFYEIYSEHNQVIVSRGNAVRISISYSIVSQIPDLKTLVPKIRSEVLVGKTLVFSGLVPNQTKLEKSSTYLIARSLGATVTQQLTDDTTHLVASTAGTFKVNAARKMSNIHIVSPEWLWTCAERWECVEEKLFPLDPKKSVKTRQPPAHCHSPGE